MKEASEQLVDLLGQPYHPQQVQAVLQPLGIKRMPKPNSYFNDDIIWSAKASIRLDIYLPAKLRELTGSEYEDPEGWRIGSVHFLAPGADDRIKAPYAAPLPGGLTMASAPELAIEAYGTPQLDEDCEWPGFDGRILAWRKPGLNLAIEYEAGESGYAMRSYTACLIGCIGAWRSDHPAIFAP